MVSVRGREVKNDCTQSIATCASARGYLL